MLSKPERETVKSPFFHVLRTLYVSLTNLQCVVSFANWVSIVPTESRDTGQGGHPGVLPAGMGSTPRALRKQLTYLTCTTAGFFF